MHAVCETQEFLELQVKTHLWNLWVQRVMAIMESLWCEVMDCMCYKFPCIPEGDAGKKYRNELLSLVTTPSVEELLVAYNEEVSP